MQEENNNLVTQARDLLRDMAKLIGKSSPFINIKLIKNLPVASGLGGGSGDAATTLILLDKIWNLNLPQNILLD
ncbi:4-(cytidine 5'-diphospho)-2-C-methyl-D-erythritol kinase, partial [Staphylococcus aureus]|nr:4-(cytidine 5'-diphospho)-2-C-methyl-D-erythritol kinase [Staphylococcus aureus]